MAAHHNNTVYNIKETKTGSPWGAAWGIAAFARIDCTNCNVWVYAKNNYVGDVVANVDYEACYDQVNSGAILYQTTNVSSDGRGTLGLRNKDQYSTYFVRIANSSEDLHDVVLRDFVLDGATTSSLPRDPNAARRARSRPTAPSRGGIQFVARSGKALANLRLEHVTVRNCTETGLAIQNARHLVLAGCSFTDNGASAPPETDLLRP